MYDVVIVGAGAAGLSAGIFASRRGLCTLIVSKEIGGQTALTHEVENYPGAGKVSGFDLMQQFRKEAEEFGCEIITEEVSTIETDDTLAVTSTRGTRWEARSIILAFGLTPRNLGVPGEEEFAGKGIYYSAIEQAGDFAGSDVVVVGGGNSALDAVVYLSKIAGTVHLVYRREKLRGDKVLIERVEALSNCKIHTETQIAEIAGGGRVQSVVLDSGETLRVRGVVVCAGFRAQTSWAQGVVETDSRNQIVVGSNNATDTQGVFAAGDVTGISEKQIVISAGEGAKAALAVCAYLQKLDGGHGHLAPDWGLV